MVNYLRVDWVIACIFIYEERPGSTKAQWWVTPTQGDLQESATENKPPDFR